MWDVEKQPSEQWAEPRRERAGKGGEKEGARSKPLTCSLPAFWGHLSHVPSFWEVSRVWQVAEAELREAQ